MGWFIPIIRPALKLGKSIFYSLAPDQRQKTERYPFNTERCLNNVDFGVFVVSQLRISYGF